MYLESYIKSKKKRNISFYVSLLIVFGVAITYRYTFGLLSLVSSIFISLNDPLLVFALQISIFFPIYKPIHSKIQETGFKKCFGKNYLYAYLFIIILAWATAMIFFSITLLNIPLGYIIPPDILTPSYDVFLLGFEWAFFIVLIDSFLVNLINRTINIEKRFPKDVLFKSIVVGGVISFGVWSIQLIVVELYLKRLFGISVYIQDIRWLIIVVSGTFVFFFFLSMKVKFLPQSIYESTVRIDELKNAYTTPSGEPTPKINRLVLKVENLTTYFYTEEGVVRAVEDVSFEIYEGEVLGLVGETGCGKSVTALSILRLIRPPGNIERGQVSFGGIDLFKFNENEILPYRGNDITMVFQDPLNSLNPVFKIGKQISEVYLLHKEDELLVESTNTGKSIYSLAHDWSVELLRNLKIAAPELIFDRYPHEISGGMRQRVQIAMALACSPKLLIADEPTTALDVTVQNQILKLMKDLQKKFDTSILFITHDLGIISKMCHRVAVMYSGYIAEYGRKSTLFSTPYHPYTKMLIASIPIMGKRREKLMIIPGMVPNLIYPPAGCRFHPRCDYCFEPCNSIVPKLIEVEPNYFVACHLYDPRFNKAEDNQTS